MTNDEQLAEAKKYSSALVWSFAEIRPGLFALYDYKRQLKLLTEDFEKLVACYRERPEYIPPVPRTSAPKFNIQINL